MKLLLPAILMASASMPPTAESRANFVSGYTKLDHCSEVAKPRPGEDWVYFRCEGFGGTPVWYVCTDSARCRYGFGVKPNVSGTFGTDSKQSWQIEWRGPKQKGVLKPVAIILRLSSLDKNPPNKLYVYRLRSDGTSCIVGEATTNSAARLIADRAAGNYQCEVEPQRL